ncbi:hypothetical protein NU195Hw_Modified_82t1 [Hortaea werneckii]
MLQPSSISTIQNPGFSSQDDLTSISRSDSAIRSSSIPTNGTTSQRSASTMTSAFPTRSQKVPESTTMPNESTISASSISISTSSMLPETTFVPECNPGQQYQYTDPSSGNPYVVQCNQTYQGIVGLATYESSPEDCISACSANSQCLGVGYDTSDGECDEYYGYAPNSGDQSPTVVFAQLLGRAFLVFGTSRTRTTTTPISTLYVSASAVTTASPSGSAFSSTMAPEFSSSDVKTTFSSSVSSRSDSTGIGINRLVNLSRHKQGSVLNGYYVVGDINVHKLVDLWEQNYI